MIQLPPRPEGVQEYTPPLLDISGYSDEDQREFYRSRPQDVVWLRDKHPDAFQAFMKKYGSDFAAEVIGFAEGAA